jgi:hypothetical protein
MVTVGGSQSKLSVQLRNERVGAPTITHFNAKTAKEREGRKGIRKFIPLCGLCVFAVFASKRRALGHNSGFDIKKERNGLPAPLPLRVLLNPLE